MNKEDERYLKRLRNGSFIKAIALILACILAGFIYRNIILESLLELGRLETALFSGILLLAVIYFLAEAVMNIANGCMYNRTLKKEKEGGVSVMRNAFLRIVVIIWVVVLYFTGGLGIATSSLASVEKHNSEADKQEINTLISDLHKRGLRDRCYMFYHCPVTGCERFEDTSISARIRAAEELKKYPCEKVFSELCDALSAELRMSTTEILKPRCLDKRSLYAIMDSLAHLASQGFAKRRVMSMLRRVQKHDPYEGQIRKHAEDLLSELKLQ